MNDVLIKKKKKTVYHASENKNNKCIEKNYLKLII